MVESAVRAELPSRVVLPFSAEQDASAELFDALLDVLGGTVPAAFLDSSDHASSPTPERSRCSILAFSYGPGAEVVRLESGSFEWLAQRWGSDAAVMTHEGGAAAGPVPLSDFQLGWVGWIGYEQQAQLFAATHAVVVDHHRGVAEIQSWGEDAHWVSLVEKAITAGGRREAPQSQLRELSVRDSRSAYLEKIQAAQEQIRDGNSYEICLTTAVTGELYGEPWAAYQQLRARNRAPFTQYFRIPGAAVLSTSPERFVSIDAEGVIRSEPIKGTRPRGSTPELDQQQLIDLQEHPKDRAENVMIADLVRNDLSIHAVPGTLRTERLCAVETYPSVHQMVSTISAQLEPGVPRTRALADAFPPGSMTGAPKISTMEILARLEGVRRGPYSGVAGWFSTTGACDLSVLIRTAVLEQRAPQTWGFHLGIGGAVTADSDPQAEWEEIVTKSRGVLGALGADFPAS